MELDEYINLTGRVKTRMIAVNLAATGDENIIKEEESKKEMDYREKQLQRLKEEVVDLGCFRRNIHYRLNFQ